MVELHTMGTFSWQVRARRDVLDVRNGPGRIGDKLPQGPSLSLRS